MQRWHVPAMPIAALLNFAISNRQLHVLSGEMTGANARIFGLPDGTGALHASLVARTSIRDLTIASPALAKPVEDIHGHLDLSASGAFTNDAAAKVAGATVRVRGGVFDASKPQVRVAIEAHGQLSQLRIALAQASRLPVRGSIDAQAIVEGAATAPLIAASIRSPRVVYLHSPIEDVRGTLAFERDTLDVLAASARYASYDASAAGRIALTPGPGAINVLADVSAPPNTVPYASDLAPGMPLRAIVLATANDPRAIRTQGVLSGGAAGRRLDASFSVTSAGTGSLGPVLLSGNGERLYAFALLNHPHGDVAAYIDARNVHLASVDVPALPGFPARALPNLSASVSGAFLATIDRGKVDAMGAGRLRSSLVALDTFIPSAHARGTLDAPLAFIAQGYRALVQLDGAHFQNASIFGVPLSGVDATVALSPSNLHVISARARIAGSDALARGMPDGGVALSAARVPFSGGTVSAGAIVSGTFSTPHARSALVANNVQYDRIPLSAIASLDYAGGSLQIRNTTLGVGDAAYVALDGSATTSHLDLDVNVRAADASALLALARPAQAGLVQGSIDADAHVSGSASAPHASGAFDVPEGSVNGLGFRDLHGTIGASRLGAAIDDGTVTVGSTRVAFHGSATLAKHYALSVDAPQANLADFDDFFAHGEALAGTGDVRASLAYARGSLATSGAASLRSLRYERIDLGSANARWVTNAGNIDLVANASGPGGTLAASGLVDSATLATNATLRVRNANLSTWLPAFGLHAPITGLLDGDARVAGRFPNIDATVDANLTQASVERLPVTAASLAMHIAHGRGTLDAAKVALAHLQIGARGSFGLHPSDPFALQANATSDNVGALLAEFTGSSAPYTGALATTFSLTGTRAHPHLTGDLTMNGFTDGRLKVPRMTAALTLTPASLAVDRAEIDFTTGRVLANAQVPLALQPFGVRANAPFDAAFTADDLALSNVGPLLPSGTHLSGRIDGTVRATGRIAYPEFSGSLALANASYSGPQLTTPVTGGAQLAFSGEAVQLRNALFHVGDGTVSALATAAVPSVQQLEDATLGATLTASDATFDAPTYFKGRIDGTLGLTRESGGPLTAGGTVTASSARVPLTAFLGASSSTSNGAPPLPIAFDGFTLTSGNDVRVQSPNVDIGATGSLTLNGTLANLQPSGSFSATGGTISFYRTFTLERGTVSFDPQSGIVPDVNAVATTFITDPDTTIRLHVTGPATNMNLALASDPGYDRSQILGLLVGAQQFGAVQGVASTGTGNFSASGEAESLAAGQLNTLFTRSLLEPLSSALASTLGVTNVQLTSNIAQGTYGASVVKAFGRDLQAIFNESLGYPQRTSIALVATPSKGSAIRATFYTQPDLTLFPLTRPPAGEPGAVGEAAIMDLQPMSGTSGISLRYERRYW